MDTFLGIDGGGSKTRALLVDRNGRQIHFAESGPSNLNAYDEAIVRESLFEVVDQCIQASGTRPIATCFGLAGAGNPDAKKKLAATITSLDLINTKVVSDAEIALEGAFAGAPGILLIAGTGSVCFGKSDDQKIDRTGGWGWLADDAGSAGWIGQRALEAALKENDGRIKGSALRDAVFSELGIRSDEEISTIIYQPLINRSKVAALSKCVLELADQENEAACRIYNNALDELEKLVRATSEKLPKRVSALALTGGLLQHNPSFRGALELRLPEFDIQKAHSTQLYGAVALALKIES